MIDEPGTRRYLSSINYNLCYLVLFQEDDAIIELVRKYGIRKWTIVSQKMEELFMMKGRSGKQCRERYLLLLIFIFFVQSLRKFKFLIFIKGGIIILTRILTRKHGLRKKKRLFSKRTRSMGINGPKSPDCCLDGIFIFYKKVLVFILCFIYFNKNQ